MESGIGNNTQSSLNLLVIVLLLVCVLPLPSCAFPNGTETAISTVPDDSAQTNPAVYGTFIAWEDWRPGNQNIYVYNLATGEEYPPAPDFLLMQTAPALYNTTLVWQQLDTGSYTYSIQVFDLASHSLSSVPANPGPDPQYTPEDNCFPKLYEDEIVWQDYHGGDWDIFLYNITTSVPSAIVTGAGDQKHPAIMGNHMAYENWSDPLHPEIWLYDIAGGSSVPVGSGSFARYPALSQTYVVWEDHSGSGSLVFGYSLATGIVSRITPASLTTEQMHPAIAGNTVVVEDYRQSANGAIYLYDLPDGTETWVSPLSGSVIQKTPAIYQDRIVWDDSRSDTSSDIYLLTRGVSESCPAADFSPSVHAGTSPLVVTFTDRSTGTPILHRVWNYSDGSTWYPLDPSGETFSTAGIFHPLLTAGNLKCRNATPGISRNDIYVDSPPSADFFGSPRQGFAPLSVQFTDSSGGEPATWSWDFGDGSVSHEQNPLHTFTTAGGSYTVSLTVNNTFAGMAPGNEIKTEYIRTFLGATGISTLPVEGIVIVPRYGGRFLLYNATLLPDMATPLPSILTTYHPDSAGWQNITFLSRDSSGFSDTFGNTTYMGNLSRVLFQTEDVTAAGTSPRIGTGWGVSYRVGTSGYPSAASLTTEIWENTTSGDQGLFDRLVIGSNFLETASGIAYTARIVKTGLRGNGNATITMSLDHTWLDGREAQTYIIGYGVNSQGDTVGSVTAARHLFHDGDLDYFEAEVPEYFTTFGIAPLAGSGNPFQLITLSVTSHVNPPEPADPVYDPSAGVESGSTTAGGAGTGMVMNPPATPTPAPVTPVPPDPGTSAKVYTNANGVVTQATRLLSTNGRTTMNIGEGVAAKEANGKPLTEISIKALSPGSLPAVPSGSPFTFAGMSYDLGPDGATFSPPVTLTFTLPQAEWGKDYSVHYFDTKAGTWQTLPTTFDAATGTVSAEVGHLSVFALFSQPRASPVTTPVATPLPLPPAPQVKAQPPATAVSIFTSMLGWAADLVMNNAIIPVVVVILAILGYLAAQGRFPGGR